LLQKGTPDIFDLKELYKIVEHIKDTADVGVLFVQIELKDSCTLSYSVSSWANASDLKTQFGLLIMFAPKKVIFVHGSSSMPDWRSFRSKRKIRSSLAGEAAAADGSVDRGHFVRMFMQELIYNERATTKPEPKIPLYHATDCKSLFDCLVKVTPSLEEKRTLIDIFSVKEHITDEQARWLPTDKQRADALTKIDVKLRDLFVQFMKYPLIELVDEATHYRNSMKQKREGRA
jgi:hypothetical protein